MIPPTNDPKAMAAACRRLAATSANKEAASFLLSLANEYEEEARKLDRPSQKN